MIEALAGSMGLAPGEPSFWMPLAFMLMLFLIIVAGVVLDGFDIGVGILVGWAPVHERGRMMALLSPWRDANEFWLLLGLGLFAAAFPFAWGVVLGKLYGPLTLMVLGAALRSVSFEFRIRATQAHKSRWVMGFCIGSIMTALGQGMALGRIATGFQTVAGYGWFTGFVGLCALATYVLLGATWLVMRVRGDLQLRAALWARNAVRWTAAGMIAIAMTLGLANAGIFYKWSNLGHLSIAALLWFAMLSCFVTAEMVLSRLPGRSATLSTLPFLLCGALVVLMLGALGFSLFPYVILDDLTLWDAAAADDSLRLLMVGVGVALPVALVFNILAYRSVFGQARNDPRPPA